MGFCRWSFLSTVALLGSTFLLGCEPAADSDSAGSAPWFREVGRSAGIDFRHVRAIGSEFYFPEIMSGGVGWIDYDGDGLLDLYLVQGGDIVERNDPPDGNVLYRNMDGTRFEDVTLTAGVGDAGYGMGVAVGDIDNDGDDDLYVTNVGPNVLYRNEGDGTFTDISAAAGVDHAGWGASAAFADYDGDGLLDLYVINYIHWSPNQELECFSGGAGRDYCHPNNYQSPANDVLFHNEGDGRFQDVTVPAGLDNSAANGLGVVPGDFDNDGRIDFYVANDGDPNQLWMNNGDGTFSDRALLAGASANRQGIAEAGMGVVAFDIESDGDLDLFLTHLRDETNTLYRNENGLFQDITTTTGLAMPSIPFTGFGVGFADFNHDALPDLYVANGRVGRAGASLADDPFAEPNHVFRGIGPGRFDETDPKGGMSDLLVLTSRGAALGDYDNDGDLDVAIVNSHGPVTLLENIAPKEGSWIGFERSSTSLSRTGTRIAVTTTDGTLFRTVQPAGSYQSSNDPRVHLGLPPGAQIQAVEVTWPDGSVEGLGQLEAGRYHVLEAR